MNGGFTGKPAFLCWKIKQCGSKPWTLLDRSASGGHDIREVIACGARKNIEVGFQAGCNLSLKLET